MLMSRKSVNNAKNSMNREDRKRAKQKYPNYQKKNGYLEEKKEKKKPR